MSLVSGTQFSCLKLFTRGAKLSEQSKLIHKRKINVKMSSCICPFNSILNIQCSVLQPYYLWMCTQEDTIFWGSLQTLSKGKNSLKWFSVPSWFQTLVKFSWKVAKIIIRSANRPTWPGWKTSLVQKASIKQFLVYTYFLPQSFQETAIQARPLKMTFTDFQYNTN